MRWCSNLFLWREILDGLSLARVCQGAPKSLSLPYYWLILYFSLSAFEQVTTEHMKRSSVSDAYALVPAHTKGNNILRKNHTSPLSHLVDSTNIMTFGRSLLWNFDSNRIQGQERGGESFFPLWILNISWISFLILTGFDRLRDPRVSRNRCKRSTGGKKFRKHIVIMT